MKGYWLLLAAVAAAMLLPPQTSAEVGELLPAELLSIYKEEGQIGVSLDTGDFGRGDSLKAALADLEASASGKVFLETADWLVVSRECLHLLPELMTYLRPATQVCLGEKPGTDAALFLRIHSPQVDLNDIRAGEREIPVLRETEGRYQLVNE